MSFVLALLVLAASVGLPVQRRTCRLSGRSTTRIGWTPLTIPGGAQPAKQTAARLAANCYAFSLQVLQLKTATSAPVAAKVLPAHATAPALLPADACLLPARLGLVISLAAEEPPLKPTGPPRPGGRQLLARLGVLVV